MRRVISTSLLSPAQRALNSPPIELNHQYIKIGNPQKVIALLHGLGDDYRIWQPLIPFLSLHFSIILIDLRGHGLSKYTDLPQDYTPIFLAKDVHVTVSSIVGEQHRVVMMGHSLGAAVATAYAHLYPKKVSCVVNIDQPLGAQSLLSEDEREVIGGIRNDDEFLEVANKIAEEMRGPLSESELIRVRKIFRPNRVIAASAWGLENPEYLSRMMEQITEIDKMPYVVVFAERQKEEVEEFLKLIPHAQVVVCEGCGHYLHLSNPKEFCEIVITQLSDIVRV